MTDPSRCAKVTAAEARVCALAGKSEGKMGSSNVRLREWMSFGLRAAAVLGCGIASLGCDAKKDDAPSVVDKTQKLGRSEADWIPKGPKVMVWQTMPGLTPTQGFPATGAVERFLVDPTNALGGYAASV